MKINQSPKKIIAGSILFLLQTIFLLTVFLLLYGVCIYVTNGFGQGKFAAVLSITVVIIFYVVLRKSNWLKSNVKKLGWLFSLLIFLIFVIYTLIPVASSDVVQKEKDFANVPTQFWNLKTGSRIAYYKLSASANVPKKETPIIFLHGGPGAYTRQMEINFFSEFTKEGYDVYLYDQAGAGRSEFLPKEQYSHQRNIKDFDAITEVINAKKYIVIGQSYGGSLLAHVTSDKKISKRIFKAIYAEPGVTLQSNIPDDQRIFSKSKPVAVSDVSLPVRIMISLLINPKGNFASQNEVINYLADHPDQIQGLFSEAYPKNDSARIPKVDIGIINFSVNTIIKSELNFYATKKDLAENYQKYNVPSMLLIGESSYIERNAPLDLLAINPNIKRVQYMKGVGHLLWNGLDNNNQWVKKVIHDFLNDHISDIPNYPGRQDINTFYKRKL